MSDQNYSFIYENFFSTSEQCLFALNMHGDLIITNQKTNTLFLLNDSHTKINFISHCQQHNIDFPHKLDFEALTDEGIIKQHKIYLEHCNKTLLFSITGITNSDSGPYILCTGVDITRIEQLNQKESEKIKQQNIHNEFSKILGSKHNPKHAPKKSGDQLSYYEDIVDLIPGIVYWKDIDGTYLGCNTGFIKQFGYEDNFSVRGKTDRDIFSQSEAEEIRDNDLRIIHSGAVQELEETVVNSSGEVDTYLSTKRPIRNTEHVIIGILGISTNITERKASETQLVNEKEAFEEFYDTRLKNLARISKETTGQDIQADMPEEHLLTIKTYLENIISCLPGLVFWKNEHGVYLGCNEGLLKWHSVESKAEIIGHTDFELFSQAEANLLRENDNEVMQKKEIVSVEETAIIENGQEVTYLSNKVPLFDKYDKAIGILGISLDITETKKAQAALKVAKNQAEQANKSKSEFLANMSHDLRAPLHGINGMIDVLESDKHSQNQADYFHTLRSASDSLLELIEGILTYSELNNKKAELCLETFDINDLIEQCVAMFKAQTHKGALNVILNSQLPTPFYVKSYPQAVKRILHNIISNALRFTEKGSVTIDVSYNVRSNASALFNISITDTGIGMPEKKLSTIFEKFSRLNPSFEGKYKGVGLGLAIVKQLLELIDGEIEVESELNEGTCFTLKIPFNIIAQKPVEMIPSDKASRHTLNAIKALQLNILIIEDDHIGQKFSQIVLSNLNCSITIAKDGETALQQLNQKYDLIFSDIGLPDITGIEIAQTIRSVGSLNKKTTLIAITGHAADHAYKACIEAGFDDVLKKPLGMAGFQATIAQWCL
jgi:PAS domain S-box-containing protein